MLFAGSGISGRGSKIFTDGGLPGNRLTRKKNLVQGRGVATTSTRRTFCKATGGGVNMSLEHTVVKRSIQFMPKTRSGVVEEGRVLDIIDLCGDKEAVPGPSRR